MIPSTNNYNLNPIITYINPNAILPILLNGRAIDYRKSTNINSINYPNCKYHFEFWHYKKVLFASIHVTHNNTKTCLNRDKLVILIDSHASIFVNNIYNNLGLNVLTFPYLRSSTHTHTLNIACPGYNISHLLKGQTPKGIGTTYSSAFGVNPNLNANIMREIIQTANLLNI